MSEKRELESQNDDINDNKPKRRKINRVNTSVDEQHELKSTSSAVAVQPCGIIERITLKNVMCHDHLDFDGFTSNVNLLRGANGSGKSTIVASIIAGLGGSSKATDRAKNLQSLIQNGKNCATIEIHLKNNGSSPYKPSLYGRKVIVERKVLLSGSNSYKIKSEKGHIVSTKKEDLNRILDWYNFQVDNPVIILSQERAKTFLSNTNPHLLFEFFMAATQMRQYIDSHKETQNNYHSSKELIQHKLESLPILESEVKKWGKKVKAISSLGEKRKILSQLRRKIAWAEVIEEEEEATLIKKKVEKAETNLKIIDNKLNDLKKKKEEMSQLHSASDAQVVAMAEQSKHVEKKRQSANAVLMEMKRKWRELLNKRKNLEKESLEKERESSILRQKLESNTTKDRNAWEMKNKENQERMMKLTTDIESMEKRLETERNLLKDINHSLQKAEDDYHYQGLEEKALISRLSSVKKDLNSVIDAKDNLTVFGAYMPNLIKEIDKYFAQRFFKDKPVGPVGMHMKVKDPKWIHVVEKVVGKGFLSSFLVSCKDDLHLLNKIFMRVVPSNVMKPQVIISPFRNKVHNSKKFETGNSTYYSMWSIIDTDNIQVANMLLDQLQVESILLVPTAKEASDLLMDKNCVPTNCKKALTLNGDTYFPDPNFKVYSGWGKKPAEFLQVSVEEKIRDLEMNLRNTEIMVDECRNETYEKKKCVEEKKNEKTLSLTKQKNYQKLLNQYKHELQELKNTHDPPPPNVYELQISLKEIEAQKLEVDRKKEELVEQLEEAKQDVAEAEHKLNVAKKESEKIRSSASEYQEETKKIEGDLMHNKKEILVLENKRKECQNFHTMKSKEFEEKEKLIDVLIMKVSDVYPERIQPSKSKKDLEREFTAQQNAIEMEEAHHGNLEDVTKNWRDKSETYEKIKEEIQSQQRFLAKLDVSLKTRSRYMDATKKLLSSVLKAAFKEKIKMRNLVGHMDIDYTAQTLQIFMRKDTGNNNHKMQSIQMMSGGERSFATVSFILALWEWIYSPIRIMDEFDIFMDVVSRNQCIEMILKAVLPKVQYIMVSPLEYRTKADNLHIFRMPSPERRNDDASEEI